ncbi:MULTISPECIES: MotA/TolQ/ExbB proton channel family protein [Arcobacter]|jgi:biopolymer transport protein ExbB/TolQ|uniref:Flagellar motor protein MotA n=1 Tax=Arcobacter ellisii TaxID=913109 RepID=A0A347U9S6_9BACT|nr:MULTISPECIES: MotA/TolQ/ExbB proton channel family protein [Arcobacter]AXX95604.1 MotA/TolQ/ExbB proton channel family protein [Arcobacter ellisii]MDY3205700.1 MotA/TolQ/ExbB proton channel family protein [Arcobacter sp.]RXI31519.1 flagellar motor protein MotA [Arcobacter ellisii]
MFSSISVGLMHQISSLLLEPVSWALIFFVVFSLYEIGITIGERVIEIKRLTNTKDKTLVLNVAKKRIERADFITRLAPMLGLMGTLIPLGPGLAALGDGDVKILSTAMSVAFDTTVLGLLCGMVGFVIARLRRRWYDKALSIMESEDEK